MQKKKDIAELVRRLSQIPSVSKDCDIKSLVKSN